MKPKPLTVPQLVMLGELAEPNRNADNVWYFPRSKLRTLQILEKRGLARHVESDMGFGKYGYAITDDGRRKAARWNAALRFSGVRKP